MDTSEGLSRPFYTEYAWAFDLLIDRPIDEECRVIEGWLRERGVHSGARVLDAGCGTGRYAIVLARVGYSVHGIDSSPELIAEACRSARASGSDATFAVGDLLTVTADGYDAVLCRGVLNDIVGADHRAAAIAGLGRSLRPGGVLVLDVREWAGTAARKTREPVFQRTLATDRGTLTFTSVTALEPAQQLMRLQERHSLVQGGRARESDYAFVMQCWTRDELDGRLAAAGFLPATCFGAFNPEVGAGTTDRLVAVAQRVAPFRIVAANGPDDVEEVRRLFGAYAASLPVDLAYQDFAHELADLPGKYAAPAGALLLARSADGVAVGCVALRPMAQAGCCEMKRLYVAAEARGLGLGRALLAAVLAEAERLGYREIRLDTLPTMTAAIAMYRAAGFSPVAPYYETAPPGTIFLGRAL
jgi:SAM-dependent methyltransferase/GNAT superfamily N-acetyltransferase